MSLVPAKCTSCCGTVEVDPTQKAAICKHCGSAYIVQDAINQYNITNVYQINKASLKVDHRQLFADRIEAAEKQLRLLKDYSKALGAFMALENDVPEEFRIWSGKLEARTGGYDVAVASNMHFSDENYLSQLNRDYENARTTGNDEQRKEINEKYTNLLKNCCENIGLAGNVLENNMKKRQKYRNRSEALAKISVVFFLLTLILGVLALLVAGFLAIVLITTAGYGNDGDALLEAIIVSAIAFTPALLTLIPVIILSIVGKKSDKKDEEISNETARIIKGELHLDIPGFTPMGEYYELYMLCRRKASYIHDAMQKIH